MTSLFARLGHSFDARRAAQTFLNTTTVGKRKRGPTQWVCAECRAKGTGRTQHQRRGYSDGGIRLGAEEYLFPQREEEADSSRGSGEKGIWGMRRRQDNSDGKMKYQPKETATEWTESQEERDDVVERFESLDASDNAQRSSILDASSVQDEYEVDAMQYQPLLKIDYKAELSEALLRAETDHVMRCLFAANQANDLDFIRAIPSTTFSEIIRLAEPRRFVSKLGSVHQELSSSMVRNMKIAPMRQVAFEYVSVIRQLLGIRKSAGIKLTLGDYTVLLRAARDLGNARMGRLLWSNLLEEGYKPNTQCYNYMMSTIVWNGVHLAGSRQKVRVIPFNMLARSKQKPTTIFHNYRVGPGGVRETAMSIFNEMLSNGAYADEESFRILMMASAREGDLQTVKSILMKVWNIDVDGIMSAHSESSMLPKQRPDHSPLRPTSELLSTLAHIFGINNDIPTALRVADFVARHYSLEIGEETWSQLVEWTFVLAMNRLNAARQRGTDVGHLPQQSLVDLWNTMIAPPYRVEPTMGMYNYLITHMFRNAWLPDMLVKMGEGREKYLKDRIRVLRAYAKFKKAVKRQRSALYPRPPDKSMETLRNQFEHMELIRQRDYFRLKRWVRLFLGAHNHYIKNDPWMDSTVRSLPRMLWDWRDEAPTEIKYETQTGLVHIEFRTHDEVLEMAKSAHVRALARKSTLNACEKLVGQAWVRGGEVTKTRRLLEHEQQLDADAGFSDVSTR